MRCVPALPARSKRPVSSRGPGVSATAGLVMQSAAAAAPPSQLKQPAVGLPMQQLKAVLPEAAGTDSPEHHEAFASLAYIYSRHDAEGNEPLDKDVEIDTQRLPHSQGSHTLDH